MDGAVSDYVSECCGAPEVGCSMDIGLCPDCKEHCDYIDLDDLDPTPWCIYCGAMEAHDCYCGLLADND